MPAQWIYYTAFCSVCQGAFDKFGGFFVRQALRRGIRNGLPYDSPQILFFGKVDVVDVVIVAGRAVGRADKAEIVQADGIPHALSKLYAEGRERDADLIPGDDKTFCP